MAEEFDIIIVGAGLAGLRAACRLHLTGMRVIVLEATERVGGRVFAAPLKSGVNRVDWGAEFVIPQFHPLVMELIERMGLHTESEAQGISWRVSGFSAEAELAELQHRRPGLGAAICALQSWFDAGGDETDDTTCLRDLLIKLADDPTDISLLEAAFFPLTGADPTEVSARSIREEIRVHGKSVILTIAPETRRISECAGTIPELLATSLPTGMIRFKTRVESILPKDDIVAVSGDGFEYWGKHALLAAPVAAMEDIVIGPGFGPLDSIKTGKMNAGKTSKMWALALGTHQATRLDSNGPLRLTYSWARNEELLLCGQALYADIVNQEIKSLFQEAFPNLKIVDADVQHWPKEPAFRASWMSAGIGTYPTDVLSSPFGRLQLIGGDIGPDWVGWMEGALLSADRAADRLIRLMERNSTLE